MKKTELLQIAKPILLNTEMVKAILDGRKTQTRRVCKNITPLHNFKLLDTDTTTKRFEAVFELPKDNWFDKDHPSHEYCTPRYKKGDILWVREPAKVTYEIGNRMKFTYLSDRKNSEVEIPSRFIGDENSLYMGKPKWIAMHQGVPNGCIKEMSRIFLKVTNVRVERLQDINDSHIFKEGFGLEKDYCDDCDGLDYCNNFNENKICGMVETPKEWWVKLWNKTAPEGYKYLDDPYVFVYEFERVEKETLKGDKI